MSESQRVVVILTLVTVALTLAAIFGGFDFPFLILTGSHVPLTSLLGVVLPIIMVGAACWVGGMTSGKK